jgi:small subunit ribosomal protein S15
VAVLSERIQRLQAHFEKNKKDIHSRRGLMELMQRRRRLLLYMAPRDPEAYVRVIERYEIREGKGPSRVSDRPETWSPPRNKDQVKFRPKNWLEFKKTSSKDVKRGKQ